MVPLYKCLIFSLLSAKNIILIAPLHAHCSARNNSDHSSARHCPTRNIILIAPLHAHCSARNNSDHSSARHCPTRNIILIAPLHAHCSVRNIILIAPSPYSLSNQEYNPHRSPSCSLLSQEYNPHCPLSIFTAQPGIILITLLRATVQPEI